MKRKKFIQVAVGIAGLPAYLSSCSSVKKIPGQIVGASATVGHLLRDNKFPVSKEITEIDIVIVGGGISGLSAARYLHKHGMQNFVVLDLEKQMGGNSAWGKNNISAYPWGAHYVPTPNNNLTEYLEFLQEANIITHVSEDGLPFYNEYYLCFDPQERLYINGHWQDGLVPHFGVPTDEADQIKRFLALMDEFRHSVGTDGKEAFAIPIDNSSKDEQYTRLDEITMKQWLLKNDFSSKYLHWYVNYCTRDDYGTNFELASAWIGIHYFAGRKGKATNINHSDVLTWPEGNGFLVKKLTQNISQKLKPASLVTKVSLLEDAVLVEYFDVQNEVIKTIKAKQCIIAAPQFISARILADEQRLNQVNENLSYAPWMVANLRVSNLQERSGAPLSWDNVLYDSNSLGYVEANHELLEQSTGVRNLTYYLPLTNGTVKEERKYAQQRTHEDWVEMIMNDLVKIHPNIKEATQEINIMIWGHAMAQPIPGIIHGNVRQQMSASINNKIHFAHSDLAGASIFEEAFYQGVKAAKKIISTKSIF